MFGMLAGKDEMRRFRRITRSCLFASTVLAAMAQGEAQAQVAAGTVIPNSARLSYERNGETVATTSNVATVQTAEVLDVTIAATAPRAVIVADGVSAVPFVVTNTGNGQEAFALSATTDQSAATVAGYAIDRDGNGVYDATVDTRIDGNVLPPLASGGKQPVFVLIANAGAVGGDITVTATARATTGSGAAGTAFAGQGDGGGDAVVGKTGATASAQTLLATGVATPTFTKAQSVRAPDGSARPMRGAVITYTLAAHFSGATPAVSIADPVPAGTAFVPGSITLDGQPLADTAGFDNGAIQVALGDVATAGDHVITFQTKIQ